MTHGRAPAGAHWSTADALVVALEGHRGSTGLLGLGAAHGVAHLLDRALVERATGGPQVAWVTVPRGTWALVDDRTASAVGSWPAPSAWDCMWTYRPLVGARDHDVERLDAQRAEVRAEVTQALARAHPTASTSPEDPRLIGWWGVRTEGRLAAVVGAMRYAPGLAPHLVSLGVDPEHRGRGLAGAVLAAAVRDGLAEGTDVGRPAVWLGLFASNEVARRVYERLGFELGHEFESRNAPA